jgi:hypothetical protein
VDRQGGFAQTRARRADTTSSLRSTVPFLIDSSPSVWPPGPASPDDTAAFRTTARLRPPGQLHIENGGGAPAAPSSRLVQIFLLARRAYDAPPVVFGCLSAEGVRQWRDRTSFFSLAISVDRRRGVPIIATPPNESRPPIGRAVATPRGRTDASRRLAHPPSKRTEIPPSAASVLEDW